jgi:hypothetical protein
MALSRKGVNQMSHKDYIKAANWIALNTKMGTQEEQKILTFMYHIATNNFDKARFIKHIALVRLERLKAQQYPQSS